MCVAELLVTTRPCQHRWYHLLRPCHPSLGLYNCQSPLSLNGWENKVEFCPWCSPNECDAVPLHTCRLISNVRDSSRRQSAVSGRNSFVGSRRESWRYSAGRPTSWASMAANDDKYGGSKRQSWNIEAILPPELISGARGGAREPSEPRNSELRAAGWTLGPSLDSMEDKRGSVTVHNLQLPEDPKAQAQHHENRQSDRPLPPPPPPAPQQHLRVPFRPTNFEGSDSIDTRESSLVGLDAPDQKPRSRSWKLMHSATRGSLGNQKSKGRTSLRSRFTCGLL
ncbi:MAG: hypothetical protein M1817_000010 [Caeruleum heppii]|nr:MAG: hypothetical protein M1817_000010 [Caeruleum heppii]